MSDPAASIIPELLTAYRLLLTAYFFPSGFGEL